MKQVVILGSTGSIGQQTIEVVKRHPDKFRVIGLSTHKNTKLLEKQIRELKPKIVVVVDNRAKEELGDIVEEVTVLTGQDGLVHLVQLSEADLIVNALVGSVGLDSTLQALKAEKTLALANKESMVAGGVTVNKILTESKAQIIPIDSEHSAIFQCLLGERHKEVTKIILTSSGGPFRGKKLAELEEVSVDEALAHPRWRMGKKVSIDSATLMNKGLEVIEAHFLFNIPYSQIEVVIHPQSIIHSMVEFKDGSVKAHLGQTDMRIPIQYALSYPERFDSPLPFLDFAEIAKLTFQSPDLDNFPCLKLAIEAGEKGQTYPAVLNAANEEAVEAFLEGKIRFTSIPVLISRVFDKHDPQEITSLKVIKEAEEEAREIARKLIEKEKGAA